MVYGKLSQILSVPIYYRLIVFSMSSYINTLFTMLLTT